MIFQHFIAERDSVTVADCCSTESYLCNSHKYFSDVQVRSEPICHHEIFCVSVTLLSTAFIVSFCLCQVLQEGIRLSVHKLPALSIK